METLADEVLHLRRCIRDLVTFTAFPAVWTGREPQAIVESFAEALLHTLHLDIVYVRVQRSLDEGAVEAARAERRPEVANQAHEIGRTLASWLQSAKLDPSIAIPNPAGNGIVQLTVIPIGYEGRYGMVVVGSQHPDFPTELDRLLLNVGANQVAVWIQAAELLAARQRSEEAERVQREFFQVTLASIGDAVIVTDPEGAVTFVNRVAEEVTGWTTADAAGKPLSEVFQIQHEETRHPIENPVTKVLRERGVVGSANHTLLIRRDGSVCPIDDSAAPIRDAQGRLLGIVLVFRDISERRHAEQILRDSEARYRTLFESIDEGFCVIEPIQDATGEVVEFRYVEANPAFAAQSGGSNVVGKTIRQVFPSEPEEWIDTYATVLNTGEPRRFVRTLVTHGRVLDLYAFRIADGTQPRVAVLFKDITAHRQATEASLRLAAIVESSADAIISKSLDGAVTSWNAAAERIFGYRAEEMIGKSILRLLPEDRHEEERLILERLRRGERVEHFETRRRTKDGRLLDMSVTISPLREGRGKIIGASKIARDITEQKRLEGELTQRAAELERLNEELQQFAYIVSHDLKEPLRNISHLVTFLAEDYQDQLDAQANAYLTRTIAATQRLHQMLNDLLAYTQVGGRDFAFDSVDCEALLMTVLEDLEVTIAERDATITHDPLPTVGGEATHLGQVFQNLIGNALKFCGQEPPRIHVSVQRDSTHWRFGVRDNGIGIAPHQAPRLFQVFQRLHTRSEYPGTGIGLAICKKIVERHGGRIWVESAPGQGATFFFTLRDF